MNIEKKTNECIRKTVVNLSWLAQQIEAIGRVASGATTTTEAEIRDAVGKPQNLLTKKNSTQFRQP